jgi:hypothetical protein
VAVEYEEKLSIHFKASLGGKAQEWRMKKKEAEKSSGVNELSS